MKSTDKSWSICNTCDSYVSYISQKDEINSLQKSPCVLFSVLLEKSLNCSKKKKKNCSHETLFLFYLWWTLVCCETTGLHESKYFDSVHYFHSHKGNYKDKANDPIKWTCKFAHHQEHLNHPEIKGENGMSCLVCRKREFCTCLKDLLESLTVQNWAPDNWKYSWLQIIRNIWIPVCTFGVNSSVSLFQCLKF